MTRFALVVGAVVGGVLIAIAAILMRGDRTDLAPVAVAPAAGATNVSTRPVITATYRRVLDPGSVPGVFRVEPPVDGDLEVVGETITFAPRRALAPATRYTVSLGPGVREVGGRTSQSAVTLAFRTRGPRLLVRAPEGTDGRLSIVDPESGAAQPITAAGEAPGPAAPSPDGDEVAYVARQGTQSWSLRAIRPDGTGERTILPEETGVVSSLAWSPRGDLISYEHQDVVGTVMTEARLWVVRPDGSDRALVYGRGKEVGSMPVWSPDGRQLAFYERQLRAVAVFDFTSALRLIRAEAGVRPTWSPDGASLAVVNRAGAALGRGVVQVAALSEGDASRRSLAEGSASDSSPAWSPSGDWIAFNRLIPEGQGVRVGVWVARPDGAEARPLHQSTSGSYLPAVWTPDGSSVAFTRVVAAPGSSGPQQEIWIAPLDGQPRLLAARGAVVAWVP